MKPPSLLTVLGSWLAVLAIPVLAQPVQPSADATATTAEKKAIEDFVRLNPFEVKAEADNSYGALNSNSLTQFDTELKNVPVSADIFTADFVRDVAVTNLEDLVLGYGAGAGVVMSNPGGDALNQQPGDRVFNQALGIRGLSTGFPRRDGFVGTFGTGTGINSLFDIERADVVRGPQGLLYGASGAGGTVNTVSKRAEFNRNFGRTDYRIDQHGSKHLLFDYNWGAENVAVRVALLDDDQRYRRLFIGHETEGIYTQLAFRLEPLRSTLRLVAGHTDNVRTVSTNQENINFTNAATDPRHNFGLAYMLRNNLDGANDPVTGNPYPGGAIANGKLTWDNLNSYAGNTAYEFVTNKYFFATAETVWTPWLATQFSGLYNDAILERASGSAASLRAPLRNGNPFNEWATGAELSAGTEQPLRRWAARGSAIVTNDLFSEFARSQTLIGYDIDWSDTGPTDYRYYLADANFNVIYNPSIPSDLGRTPLPISWWSVNDGPVKNPLGRGGSRRPRLTYNGQNYVRMERNPRDPSWVRPNNPLGLASLAGNPGVSGQSNLGHQWESRTAGFYAANNTAWWNDRIHTLVGVRFNDTYNRTPNVSNVATAAPWAESETSDTSYNLGINGSIRPWLNAFYSYSSTYNTPLVNANDPLGNAPRTSSGVGQEIGLKFGDERGRISGSIQYYTTDSKDEMVNAGAVVHLINPTGLNGSFDGPAGAKNQWINLDRTTSGIEVILTANPTRNWKVRLAAASSDGRTLSDKTYPLLWNDDFHLSNGVVTYQNGAPFLVPTTPGVIASRIATLNGQVNPATLQTQAGGTWEPLTLAMMNDPSNPYWATPANDNGRIQTSNLRRVLQFFVGTNGSALTGRTGLSTNDIPYAWTDPNGSQGRTVVAEKGEFTVGYAKYMFSMTNSYSFTGENFLKGFTIGSTVGLGLDNRTFYYNTPGGGRELYSSPDTWQVNAFASYRRKLGKRFEFTSQVNISNVFNHYVFGTLPNNGSGYTTPDNLAVTLYGQPRLYVWTNSISF